MLDIPNEHLIEKGEYLSVGYDQLVEVDRLPEK